MYIFDEIVAIFPEITVEDFGYSNSIVLRNDGGDDYIESWNYSKPIPTSLKKYLKK
jgi:hypothetical protein